MKRGVAWLIAAGVVLTVATWQTMRLASAAGTLPVLYTLGGDFELASTRADVTRLSDFAGDIVLLNFGYTSCPDVCPAALARMRDALALLPRGNAPGRDARVQPLFVTLDPERDTPDRLAPYMDFFGPEFVAMHGPAEAIAAAAAGYRVFYEKEAIDSEFGYTISHSSHIYLIDANGRVRATFGEGVPVHRIAETVSRLQDETD